MMSFGTDICLNARVRIDVGHFQYLFYYISDIRE